MFRISNKKALCQELKCRVILLLPGEELEINYNANSNGLDIMNEVVKELDLLDKDYYGLKLHDQIHWLDLTKSVCKQTKGLDSVVFELRFKYYPAEPALLANESTRYYLYLQLRLDLIEGRLKSDSQESLAYLIACILQSELGDCTAINSSGSTSQSKNNNKRTGNLINDNKTNTGANQTTGNYVAEFKFVPNQTEDLEWAAIRLHENEDFQGLKPAESELNFLKKACQLDTYGIDPYPVKEGNSHNHFLIGVNHLGVSTFQDFKKINQFKWEEIERISLDNKLVLIYCRKLEKKSGDNKTSKSRPLFGFRCPSQAYAHNFWKIATEHRYFFTLESTPDLPIVTNTGGLFKKSHKLKYTGRVEKDLLRDHVDESRSSGVKRSHSLMSKTNVDGPRWQGFNSKIIGQQNNNSMQSSMNNIYSSEHINKTMPSNINYFREEDEGELGDNDELLDDCNSNFSNQPSRSGAGGVSVYTEHNKRRLSSTGSSNVKDSNSPASSKAFSRKSMLTTKSSDGNAIRRGSQVYMDLEQQQKTNDFIKTTLFLLFLIILFLLTILLINDSDRPNSISLLVKKMNLENVSMALRQHYYLPLKSALRNRIGKIFSLLDDTRLF